MVVKFEIQRELISRKTLSKADTKEMENVNNFPSI